MFYNLWFNKPSHMNQIFQKQRFSDNYISLIFGLGQCFAFGSQTLKGTKKILSNGCKTASLSQDSVSCMMTQDERSSLPTP